MVAGDPAAAAAGSDKLTVNIDPTVWENSSGGLDKVSITFDPTAPQKAHAVIAEALRVAGSGLSPHLCMLFAAGGGDAPAPAPAPAPGKRKHARNASSAKQGAEARGQRRLGKREAVDPSAALTVVRKTPTTLEIAKFRGPKPYPVVGNLPHIFPDSHGKTVTLGRKFDYVFALTLRGDRVIVIGDPELVQEVFERDDEFQKISSRAHSQYASFRATTGPSIIAGDDADPEYQRAKEVLQAPFGAHNMESFFDATLAATREGMDYVLGTADEVKKEGGLAKCPHLKKLSASEMRKLVKRGQPLESACPAGVTLASPLMDEKGGIDGMNFASYIALDVLARAGFEFPINLNTPRPHGAFGLLPDTAGEMLDEVFQHSLRPRTVEKVAFSKERKRYAEQKAFCFGLLDEMLAARRQDPQLADKKDFVASLLNGGDSPEFIKSQLLSLLFAGHETTASTMAWLLYFVSLDADVEERMVREIESVLGDRAEPTFADLPRFKYIEQVINETLRLRPPFAAVSKMLKDEKQTTLGDFKVKPQDQILVSHYLLGRNQKTWGKDADQFRPSRMEASKRRGMHPFGYIPFSVGRRSCIGRQYAMMEAKIFAVLVFRKFSFSYLGSGLPEIRPGVITKPHVLSIGVQRRTAVRMPAPVALVQSGAESALPAGSEHGGNRTRILYGSNAGQCEEYAFRLSTALENSGVEVELLEMNEACDLLKPESLKGKGEARAIFVCSSYNGMAPDNASTFMRALEAAAVAAAAGGDGGGGPLKGLLSFAVFGCGNSNWPHTFQRIPKLLDEQLTALGARAIVPGTYADAQAGSMDGVFTTWNINVRMMINALVVNSGSGGGGGGRSGSSGSGGAAQGRPRKGSLTGIMEARGGGTVRASVRGRLRTARDLQRSSAGGDKRNQRHAMRVAAVEVLCDHETGERELARVVQVDLALPKNRKYQTGDYLLVYPENDQRQVDRLLKHLGVSAKKNFSVDAEPAAPPQAASSAAAEDSLPPLFKLVSEEMKAKGGAGVRQQSLLEISTSSTERVTVGKVAQRFLDLTAVPARELLGDMAEHAGDAAERRTLRKLGADFADSVRLYEALVAKPRVDLVTLLLCFPSAKLSFLDVVTISRRMQPRTYSISSSATTVDGDPRRTVRATAKVLQEVVDVVTFPGATDERTEASAAALDPEAAARAQGLLSFLARTRATMRGDGDGDGEGEGGDGEGGGDGDGDGDGDDEADDDVDVLGEATEHSKVVWRGRCSTFLGELTPEQTVFAGLRKSTFRLPAKLDAAPIIMICAGTGIAPFMGFLEDIDRARQEGSAGNAVEVDLYFGCRYEGAGGDFLYAADLEAYAEAGVLAKVFPAFSRDAGAGGAASRGYVQDVLLGQAERFAAQLRRGALVYMCGSASGLGRGVAEAIQTVAIKAGLVEVSAGGDEAKAGFDFLMSLRTAGRLHEDLWG